MGSTITILLCLTNPLAPNFGQDLADYLFSIASPGVILGTWLVDTLIWSIQNSFTHTSGISICVAGRLGSVETLDWNVSTWSLQHGDLRVIELFTGGLASPRTSGPRETGDSCLAFSHLSTEVTQLYFHHTLLGEVVISPSWFKGRGHRPRGEECQGLLVDRHAGCEILLLLSLENIICHRTYILMP